MITLKLKIFELKFLQWFISILLVRNVYVSKLNYPCILMLTIETYF